MANHTLPNARNAQTSMSCFERIYLASCAGAPYFPLSELHRMHVVRSICRYRAEQIETALGGLVLHRSKSALELQLTRVLTVLAEQFGVPAPSSPSALEGVSHAETCPTTTPRNEHTPSNRSRRRDHCEICGTDVRKAVPELHGRARCPQCSAPRPRRLVAIALDGVTLSPVCRDCGTAKELCHRCTRGS